MKYLIIGAGGTGGALAAYMGRAGKDVTLIARGEHLAAIKEQGITLISDYKPEGEQIEHITNIRAMSSDEYVQTGEVPEVIFLCTKSYSLESIAPFINQIVGPDTILIPILNGIKMGDYTRKYISGCRVIDGCIYIIGMKDGPGRILMKNQMLRVVFGSDTPGVITQEETDTIYNDLKESSVRTVASDNILRDTIRKYSYIGPAAGTGILYNCKCGGMHVPGEAREFFISMIKEVASLAQALGVQYDIDLVQINLDILDNSSADSDTSLQRDIRDGGNNEFDSLIIEPKRIGDRLGVDMPCYGRVIEYFTAKGDN